MKKPKVSVVDYGLGNLRSVSEAFTWVGAETLVATKPEELAPAELIVLPGVGAFPLAMETLSSTGLATALVAAAGSGAPLFGICLGMQLLFETSEELRTTAGLGLIPGKVTEMISPELAKEGFRKTQVGWRELALGENIAGTGFFQNYRATDSFYFVHSYAAEAFDQADELASVQLGGFSVGVAFRRENISGVQFHPEKSGDAGLRLLESLVRSNQR